MGELLQKRDTKNLAETWHENQPPIVIKSMSPSWRGELFGLIPIDFMSAPTAIETCVAVAQAAPVVKSPYKMISFCVIIGPFKLTTKRVLAQFS